MLLFAFAASAVTQCGRVGAAASCGARARAARFAVATESFQNLVNDSAVVEKRRRLQQSFYDLSWKEMTRFVNDKHFLKQSGTPELGSLRVWRRVFGFFFAF